MTTVQNIINQKNNRIFSVHTSDPVEKALILMRDNRVRSTLVIDDGELKGIVSQGDCAMQSFATFSKP
jgi:CBS domain-containing protein